MNLRINAARLQQRFEAMSAVGKLGETGTRRPAHSPEERAAFELASGWMREAGMDVHIDAFGNLVGMYRGLQPALPVLMMGSHLDSQPYGGRFDGVAGVLGAIEVVHTLHEQGVQPERSIHVVSFADEEGWRFKKGLFGSRGILGKLEPGELERTDADGITRAEALKQFGGNPAGFEAAQYPPGSIDVFLELHIEQGPVLDRMHEPVGIVTGISGPLWLTVTLEGMAGHTGSVPMAMRQDALLGAAAVTVALHELVTADAAAPTVGTVATMEVFPASRNIIAERVQFTVDLRDIDLDRRNRLEQELRQTIAAIAQRHQLNVNITEDTNSPPRYCAPWIRRVMTEQCRKLGLQAPELMSGPFHDALALSYACDYGMIFVRSKDGISHNPKEYSSYEDLALATEVLYGTVVEILQGAAR